MKLLYRSFINLSKLKSSSSLLNNDYKNTVSPRVLTIFTHADKHEKRKNYGIPLALLLSGIAGVVFYHKNKKHQVLNQCLENKKSSKVEAGKRQKNLPDYTYDQIGDHTSEETGIWVVYKDGVYDITRFIKNHPGGTEKISMAMGTSVEPFWNMYRVHLNDHVLETLETLRIGNVHPDEEKLEFETEDFYAHEPKRSPLLKVNAAKPFNAESPAKFLATSFYTPNDLFFVRNHLPVPKMDELKREVQLGGIGFKGTTTLSIEELKAKYPHHEISSTVMCAGNRRSDMYATKPIKGLMWGVGAASNAKWAGVKLCDVLKDHGISGEGMDGYHITFQGSDMDIEGKGYGASIPIEIAVDPNREVLLAFEMNGKELPLDHGYPIRVVVPGVIGARQVKWLKRIEVSDKESESFWQQKDYKMFNPSKSIETADTTKAKALQEFPVQSAICSPANGSDVDGKRMVEVKGYALSGGGRQVIRVDVSVDGGKEWIEGELIKPVQQVVNRNWSWSLWTVKVPVTEAARKCGTLEVICKATDSSHNTQPESDLGIWNTRGLLENKWPRVKLNVK